MSRLVRFPLAAAAIQRNRNGLGVITENKALTQHFECDSFVYLHVNHTSLLASSAAASSSKDGPAAAAILSLTAAVGVGTVSRSLTLPQASNGSHLRYWHIKVSEVV
jgi:hypothetical protein